jgi:hypothetical protein
MTGLSLLTNPDRVNRRASLTSLVPAFPSSDLPWRPRSRWGGPGRRCRRPRHTACPGPARAGQRDYFPGVDRGGLGAGGRPGGRAAGLGGALDGLGGHADPGQVGQQRGGLPERDFRARPGRSSRSGPATAMSRRRPAARRGTRTRGPTARSYTRRVTCTGPSTVVTVLGRQPAWTPWWPPPQSARGLR